MSSNTFYIDERVSSVDKPAWGLGGNRQAILGSDFLIVDPSNRWDDYPSVVDFDIHSDQALLFGPNTRFHVKGVFVQKAEGEADWTPCKATEASKVLLQPNWFEHLIKSVDVFQQNQRISTSTESRFIAPHLNSLFYYYMDPIQKKILCPQSLHPANCLPTGANTWATDSDAYKKYAARVFIEKELDFHWIPYHCYPFFQHSNFLVDGSIPKLLPMQGLGKLQVRLTFHDKPDVIFRKVANNTTKYMFKIESIQLVMEEARLTPAFERALLSKREIVYPGVTKLMLAESVIEASPNFKTKFQDIFMPESILIFCLNKNVLSGTYAFSDTTNTNIFEDHGIQYVDLTFGGKAFNRKGPSLGRIDEDHLDPKRIIDLLDSPIFGVNMDPSKINLEELRNGAAKSIFPHVYIPLTQFGSRERRRIVPFLDDGSCLSKRADFELDIKFDKPGAKKSVIYCILASYSDCCAILDLKTKQFHSPYLTYMN